MIERYTLTSLDDVAQSFGAKLPEGATPRFNIAPLQLAPIRTASALVIARWGLLPPWRGHGGKRGPHVLRAAVDPSHGDAIDQVPLLRNAFKSQRCLVIADGFFVLRRAGKKLSPVWVHPAPGSAPDTATGSPPDPAPGSAHPAPGSAHPASPIRRSRPIAFAGLAATHKDDGQLSFAIIIGPASPLVASLVAAAEAAGPAGQAAAPTMPIIIPATGYAAWLTGSHDAARAQLDITIGWPTGWRADPVSARVSSIDHDDATCVEPIGNPAQGELF